MVLLYLLVGQNQKRLFPEPLNHNLRHLSGTQNAIQPGSATVRAAQHGRVDRLRAQTTHLYSVITMGNG
jgi:hypothetical protein